MPAGGTSLNVLQYCSNMLFRILRIFIVCSSFFCFAGVARYATNNMTSVTQINSFVMRITHFQCGFYISVTQNGLHIHDLTG